MEVNFSRDGDGKCPLCSNRKNCNILNRIRRAANDALPRKYDYVMEIVINKCPGFEE